MKQKFSWIILIILSLCVGIYLAGRFDSSIRYISSFSLDSKLLAMFYKSIATYGISGIFFNPTIGAPEGSYLIDFPCMDMFFTLQTWIVSLFCSEYNHIAWANYIISFITSAVAMYFLLSKYVKSNFVSIIFSILFAITPYHIHRNIVHATLSNYFCIPIGIYLALFILEIDNFKNLFLKDNRWKLIGIILLCCLLGMNNLYYVFFSCMLIGLAIITKCITRKSLKPFIQEAWILYLVIFVFLICLFSVLFNILIDSNKAFARQQLEPELLGLKIIQLLLPPSFIKIDWLRNLTNKYYTLSLLPNIEGYQSSLGLVGSLGFVFLLLFFYIRVVKEKCLLVKNNIDKIILFLALSCILLIFYCSIGGLGTIFSFLITPEIRAPNRASIFIVAFSLMFLSLVFDILLKHKKYLTYVILGIFLGYSLILETRFYHSAPQEMKETDIKMTDYFSKISQSLSGDGLIYQLPYCSFPEVPAINKMTNYSHFIGYLYTNNLNIKWSYGGTKNRVSLYKVLNIDGGMSLNFIKKVYNYGFNGIFIDTFGYEDNGEKINKFYQQELKLEPIVSFDKRYYFYKLDLEKFQNKLPPNIVDEYSFKSSDKNSSYIFNNKDIIKEDFGSWLRGRKVDLYLFYTNKYTKDLNIYFDVIPFVNEKHPMTNARIYVNNVKINEWIFTNTEKYPTTKKLVVPIKLLEKNKVLKIHFELDNRISAKKLGLGNDTRKLAIALVKARIE